MLLLLFVRFLAGSWLSLKSLQCSNSESGISNTYLCYNTGSGITCFTTFFTSHHLPVRMPFENASDWCKTKVPGSSLVVVKSEQDQNNLKLFIGRQALQNETIITDARKLSTSESRKRSSVNGHQIIPSDGGTAMALNFQQKSSAFLVHNVSSKCHYICESLDSNPAFSFKQNNKSYNVSQTDQQTWYDARNKCLRLGGDLVSNTDLKAIGNWSWLTKNQKYWTGLQRQMWIWIPTGAAITYTNWKGGHPEESSDNQCICINPQCSRDNDQTICDHDRKWGTCNCNHSYAIVCQRENKSDAVTTEIVANKEMLPSTSTTHRKSAIRSTPPAIATTTFTKAPIATTPVKTNTFTKTPIPSAPTTTTSSTKTSIATTPTTTATTTITTTTTTATTKPVISSVTTYTSTIAVGEIDRKTVSSSSLDQRQSIYLDENQTTAFELSSTGLFKSFNTTEILLIILLLVAVAFIVVVVILVIRRRKYYRRNEVSPTRNTKQCETVSSVYATVVKVNRPSAGTVEPGNTIYTDVEMIQRPTPSNSSIYANFQPTSEADDMGESLDYVNLDLLKKDQHKPTSADKITACFSPIYSQTCKLPTSASGKVYAEPFKPDKRPTATAPVLSHHNAAEDQQNIYPLAEAIPLGDFNAIYSQLNKPTKSSTQTGRPAMDAGPIYLDAIEVKHGAGSRGVATEDPSAVYAEPMKLKKSTRVLKGTE